MVLDLGSGAGRHSIHLANEGFHVVAFDISSSALKQLIERSRVGRGAIFIVQSEMSKLPFADGSFDAVVSNNVLHHSTTTEISESIGEMHRVMKRRAVGYVSVLSRNDYKYGAGTALEPATYVSTEEDERGITHHFFSREELVSCFSKFEVLSLDEELIPIQKGNRGHFHLRFRK